jgi:hypothetical protein
MPPIPGGVAHQSAEYILGAVIARPTPPGHGKVSSFSSAYIRKAKTSCFMLLRHTVLRACSLVFASAGRRRAAMMAITIITTKSSIREKPPTPRLGGLWQGEPIFGERTIVPWLSGVTHVNCASKKIKASLALRFRVRSFGRSPDNLEADGTEDLSPKNQRAWVLWLPLRLQPTLTRWTLKNVTSSGDLHLKHSGWIGKIQNRQIEA